MFPFVVGLFFFCANFSLLLMSVFIFFSAVECCLLRFVFFCFKSVLFVLFIEFCVSWRFVLLNMSFFAVDYAFLCFFDIFLYALRVACLFFALLAGFCTAWRLVLRNMSFFAVDCAFFLTFFCMLCELLVFFRIFCCGFLSFDAFSPFLPCLSKTELTGGLARAGAARRRWKSGLWAFGVFLKVGIGGRRTMFFFLNLPAAFLMERKRNCAGTVWRCLWGRALFACFSCGALLLFILVFAFNFLLNKCF